MNRKRMRLPFILIIVFLAGATGRAEDLTIEEAVETAFKNHPTLASLQSAVELNEYLLKQEKASRHPVLDYGISIAGYVDEQVPLTDNGQFTSTISGSYVLYNPSREASIDSQSKTLQASRHELARFKRRLRHTVETIFVDVYLAEKALEVEKKSQEYYEELKANAAAQFEEGLIPESDYLTFSDAHNQSRAQVENLEYGRKAAFLALEKLLLIELPDETKLLLPDASSDFAADNQESLVARAIERRSDIRSMRLKLSALESGISAARGARKPSVVVGADYNLTENAITDLDHNDDNTVVYAQLQWRVYDGGARDSRVNSLHAKLESAQQEYRKLEWDARSEVLDATFKITSSMNRIRIQEQSVEDSEKNLSIQTERYREGLVKATEVTDAELSLTRSRLLLIQARADLGVALSALELATGGNEK